MSEEPPTLFGVVPISAVLGPPPSIAEAVPDDELGKAREIRNLRSNVADLERKLVAAEKRALGTLTPVAAVRELGEHGYRCGFHPQVIVSDKSDRVECAVCGEPLVAIEVLRRLANHEMQFVSFMNTWTKERDALKKEVEKLRETKRALQGDIRRRTGQRKCRRCSHEYAKAIEGREVDRCPECGMPATGPASVRVPR